MTLSEFNPKLLNFLYELTRLDRFNSSLEIAKSIKLEGDRRVTPKTVRNWFKFLLEPYEYKGYSIERKLSYFPAVFKNKLGLHMVLVFYANASPSLIELFPMRVYVGWLYDAHSNNPVLVVEYIVPTDNLNDFLLLLGRVREAGFCSDISSYVIGSSFTMNSPFHKVIDINGNFHSDRNDSNEIGRQVENLDAFLESAVEARIIPYVKDNPLVIPVLAESMYELRSSVQVWNAVKKKLGDSVWDFVRHSRKKSDGVGVKKVQGIMKNLSGYGLLNQMRGVYFPFEMVSSFCIWVVFDFRNREELIRMAEVMLTHSIIIRVFPMVDRRTLITALVNGESMQNLLGSFSSTRIERMFFFDYPKSPDLVTTTRHSIFAYAKIFDPITCSWRYYQDELLSEIENLS